MKDPQRQFVDKLLSFTGLLVAIEMTLAVALAYFAGDAVSHVINGHSYISALWCIVSTVIVLQNLLHETINAGWLRIIGSFIGSAMSGIAASMMGYHVSTLLVAVFLTVIIATLCRVGETLRLSVATVTIIIIIGMVSPSTPVWLNSVSRFVESVIGTLIGIGITALFLPLKPQLPK